MRKVPFNEQFHDANPDALDLLNRLLAFDPTGRITVEEALEHRYLQIWHDASDEPTCPTQFDFSFEVVDDVPTMRQMILQEVIDFRKAVRTPQGANASVSAQPQQAPPQSNVPMPDQRGQTWRQEDPRPQEMSQLYGQHENLEQELAMGADAMQA